MRLLIDTNVILDVLLDRQPFCDSAVAVLALVEEQGITEYVTASSITDIYYIVHRQVKSKQRARELLTELLKIVDVATVSREEIEMALSGDWADFEDAVQNAAALHVRADWIVTRNTSDFRKADVQAINPDDLLRHLGREVHRL